VAPPATCSLLGKLRALQPDANLKACCDGSSVAARWAWLCSRAQHLLWLVWAVVACCVCIKLSFQLKQPGTAVLACVAVVPAASHA